MNRYSLGVCNVIVLAVFCAMFPAHSAHASCASVAMDQMNSIRETASKSELVVLGGTTEETEEYDADVSQLPQPASLVQDELSVLVDKMEQTEEYDADVNSFTATSSSGCTAALYTSNGNYDADIISVTYSSACDTHVTRVINTTNYTWLNPNPSGGCWGHVLEEDDDEYSLTIYDLDFHGTCNGTLATQRLAGPAGSVEAEVFTIDFAKDCAGRFTSPVAAELADTPALQLAGGCQARIADDLAAGEVDAVAITVPRAALLVLRSEGIDLQATLFTDRQEGEPLQAEDVVTTGAPTAGPLAVPVAAGRYWLHLTSDRRFAGDYQLNAWLLTADPGATEPAACQLP